MSFHQQHIVITGAASGIGKAIMTQLSFYECKVLAVDKDASNLKIVQSEMVASKMQLQILELDLELSMQDLVPLSLERLGRIDLFFANAGFALYGSFMSQDFNARQSQLNVNFVSVLEGLYQMLHAQKGTKFSYIITASAMAKTGMPNYAFYAATKAALDRFAQCFRFENNPDCHLMLVYPIATRTDFFKSKENTPIPWPSQSAETVAKSILKSVLKKKKSVYPSLLFRCMISLQLFNQWLIYPYQVWNKQKES